MLGRGEQMASVAENGLSQAVGAGGTDLAVASDTQRATAAAEPVQIWPALFGPYGEAVYQNPTTGETTRVDPLKKPWRRAFAPDLRPYYHNLLTREVSWDRPADEILYIQAENNVVAVDDHTQITENGATKSGSANAADKLLGKNGHATTSSATAATKERSKINTSKKSSAEKSKQTKTKTVRKVTAKRARPKKAPKSAEANGPLLTAPTVMGSEPVRETADHAAAADLLPAYSSEILEWMYRGSAPGVASVRKCVCLVGSCADCSEELARARQSLPFSTDAELLQLLYNRLPWVMSVLIQSAALAPPPNALALRNAWRSSISQTIEQAEGAVARPWSSYVDELVAFRSHHGHISVPASHPGGLGLWLEVQRSRATMPESELRDLLLLGVSVTAQARKSKETIPPVSVSSSFRPQPTATPAKPSSARTALNFSVKNRELLVAEAHARLEQLSQSCGPDQLRIHVVDLLEHCQARIKLAFPCRCAAVQILLDCLTSVVLHEEYDIVKPGAVFCIPDIAQPYIFSLSSGSAEEEGTATTGRRPRKKPRFFQASPDGRAASFQKRTADTNCDVFGRPCGCKFCNYLLTAAELEREAARVSFWESKLGVSTQQILFARSPQSSFQDSERFPLWPCRFAYAYELPPAERRIHSTSVVDACVRFFGFSGVTAFAWITLAEIAISPSPVSSEPPDYARAMMHALSWSTTALEDVRYRSWTASFSELGRHRDLVNETTKAMKSPPLRAKPLDVSESISEESDRLLGAVGTVLAATNTPLTSMQLLPHLEALDFRLTTSALDDFLQQTVSLNNSTIVSMGTRGLADTVYYGLRPWSSTAPAPSWGPLVRAEDVPKPTPKTRRAHDTPITRTQKRPHRAATLATQSSKLTEAKPWSYRYAAEYVLRIMSNAPMTPTEMGTFALHWNLPGVGGKTPQNSFAAACNHNVKTAQAPAFVRVSRHTLGAYRLHPARYNMQMALPSHIPPLEQTREKYKSEIAAFLRETALIVPSSCLCGEVVNSYDTKRQFLVCYDCNVRYHVSCLGISAQDASELDIFQCIMCAQATEGSAGMFSESKSESAAATKDETSCVILRTSSPESSLQSDAIECIYCSRSADDDLLLLCDGCEAAAHTYCLSPPLSKVPRGDWFCETCVFEAESATTSTANGRKRTRNVITSTRTQSGASSPNSPPASQTQVEDGALIQSARSYAEPSNVLISRDSPDKSGHDFGIDDGSVDQEESDIRPISVLSPTNTRDESTD